MTRAIATFLVTAAVIVVICWILAPIVNSYCHGQCKHDVKCQERCIDRKYCPAVEDTGEAGGQG